MNHTQGQEIMLHAHLGADGSGETASGSSSTTSPGSGGAEPAALSMGLGTLPLAEPALRDSCPP